MVADREAAIVEINDWAVEQSLKDADMEPLFLGVCDRAAAAGIPICRVNIVIRALHPMVGAVSYRWWRDAAPEHRNYRRSSEISQEWEQSPLARLTQLGHNEQRINLEDRDGDWKQHPLLVELRGAGITDYFGRLTLFGSEAKARAHLDGMLVSWATDRPGGFSGGEISALRRIQSRLAVGIKMANREETALNVVNAYLGVKAGRHVLDGQIQRGDGELLHAVIWYSDLRDSTPLAETLAGTAYLDLLNRYYECTAGVVLEHGGEVLRFIGDAVLAIFQFEGPRGNERAARTALAAALDAERRLGALNEARRSHGEENIDFGVALHVGDMLFGNVGVPERIDFTVVGAAVNEAARLEGLTKSLGRRILASNAFARLLPLEWESLGETALRGVEAGLRVYAPPPAA